MIPYIPAFWYISNNFGDNLNHFLLKTMSGLPVVYIYERKVLHYILCGSILAEANEYSTVCGAGFGNKNQKMISPKADVRSVRGKMSASLLGKNDIPLGDPAVLMPVLYPGSIKKRYRHSIIPHWSDYAYFLSLKLNGNKMRDVHIIDPFLPVKEFIDEVVESENILSTGLHGLIIADAYGIPNAWLDLGMDEFKFIDYYTTTATMGVRKSELNFDGCQVNEYAGSYRDLISSYPFADITNILLHGILR